MKKKSAFTLAEILTALAILGVIAVFTIPKILSSTNDSERETVIKESYAALSDIIYTGKAEGAMYGVNWTANANIADYIFDHMNYTKKCTNSYAQGCWANSGYSDPGLIMHNGAYWTHFRNWCYGTGVGNEDCALDVYFDWNGADGPNTLGDDQFKFWICYSGNAAARLVVLRYRRE